MTPTPEATEALAMALAKERALKTMMARYGQTSEFWWRDRAKAILAALPEGWALVKVDAVDA
jgi:hypothetical protein